MTETQGAATAPANSSTGAWLKAKLGSITYEGRTLPANEDSPDPRQPYPQIVYSMNRASPVRRRTGNFKVWDEEVWTAKVITEGTSGTARRLISDEMYRRLDGVAGEWAPFGGLIVSCSYDQAIRYPESGTTGPTFLHGGAMWRIRNSRDPARQ